MLNNYTAYSGDTDEFWEYAKHAARMSKEQGKVIDVTRRPFEAVTSDKPTKLRRLRDMSEFIFFTFGPVYIHCGVATSLMEDFIGLTKYSGPYFVFRFNQPIIAGINEWEGILEAIHKDAQEDLFRFAATQSFVRRSSREYWGIERHELGIIDPFAITDNNLVDGEPAPEINVFMPSGNLYRLSINSQSYPPFLQKRPPLRDKMIDAKVIFGTVKDS